MKKNNLTIIVLLILVFISFFFMNKHSSISKFAVSSPATPSTLTQSQIQNMNFSDTSDNHVNVSILTPTQLGTLSQTQIQTMFNVIQDQIKLLTSSQISNLSQNILNNIINNLTTGYDSNGNPNNSTNQISYLSQTQIQNLTTIQLKTIIMSLTGTQIPYLLNNQLTDTDGSILSSLTTGYDYSGNPNNSTNQISYLSSQQLIGTGGVLNNLTQTQIGCLISQLQDTGILSSLTGTQIGYLTSSQLQLKSVFDNLITTQQIQYLIQSQIQAFTSNQLTFYINKLPSQQLGYLTSTQVQSIDQNTMALLISKLPALQIGYLTSAQLFGTKYSNSMLQYLNTPTQFGGLTQTQIQLLSSQQVHDSISPTLLLSALQIPYLLPTTQLTSDVVSVIPSTYIKYLTQTQLTSVLSSLSTSTQIPFLSYTQLQNLTQVQLLGPSNNTGILIYLTITQLGGLTPIQAGWVIAANRPITGLVLNAYDVSILTATQVGSMTASQISSLSTIPEQYIGTAVKYRSQIKALRLDYLTTGYDANGLANNSQKQIQALTTTQISNLLNIQVINIKPFQFKYFSGSQIGAFNSSCIAALGSNHFSLFPSSLIPSFANNISYLNQSSIQALNMSQINSLTTQQIQALTNNQISWISPTQITWLTTTQVQAITSTKRIFSPAQIQAFSSSQIPYINVANLDLTTGPNIVTLTNDQQAIVNNIGLTDVTSVQAYAYTYLMVQALNVKYLQTTQLSALTSFQVASLTATQLSTLSSTAKASLGSNANLGADSVLIKGISNIPSNLSTLPLSSGVASDLTISSLNKYQMASLNPVQVSSLTSQQLNNLNPKQIGYLTLQSINALNITQVNSLPITNTANYNNANVASYNFTTTKSDSVSFNDIVNIIGMRLSISNVVDPSNNSNLFIYTPQGNTLFYLDLSNPIPQNYIYVSFTIPITVTNINISYTNCTNFITSCVFYNISQFNTIYKPTPPLHPNTTPSYLPPVLASTPSPPISSSTDTTSFDYNNKYINIKSTNPLGETINVSPYGIVLCNYLYIAPFLVYTGTTSPTLTIKDDNNSIIFNGLVDNNNSLFYSVNLTDNINISNLTFSYTVPSGTVINNTNILVKVYYKNIITNSLLSGTDLTQKWSISKYFNSITYQTILLNIQSINNNIFVNGSTTIPITITDENNNVLYNGDTCLGLSNIYSINGCSLVYRLPIAFSKPLTSKYIYISYTPGLNQIMYTSTVSIQFVASSVTYNTNYFPPVQDIPITMWFLYDPTFIPADSKNIISASYLDNHCGSDRTTPPCREASSVGWYSNTFLKVCPGIPRNDGTFSSDLSNCINLNNDTVNQSSRGSFQNQLTTTQLFSITINSNHGLFLCPRRSDAAQPWGFTQYYDYKALATLYANGYGNSSGTPIKINSLVYASGTNPQGENVYASTRGQVFSLQDKYSPSWLNASWTQGHGNIYGVSIYGIQQILRNLTIYTNDYLTNLNNNPDIWINVPADGWTNFSVIRNIADQVNSYMSSDYYCPQAYWPVTIPGSYNISKETVNNLLPLQIPCTGGVIVNYYPSKNFSYIPYNSVVTRAVPSSQGWSSNALQFEVSADQSAAENNAYNIFFGLILPYVEFLAEDLLLCIVLGFNPATSILDIIMIADIIVRTIDLVSSLSGHQINLPDVGIVSLLNYGVEAIPGAPGNCGLEVFIGCLPKALGTNLPRVLSSGSQTNPGSPQYWGKF